MKLVRLDENVIGEKIGFNVFDKNGNILISSGTILISQYVRRLEKMDIKYLYIEDDTNIDFQEVFPAKVKVELIKALSLEFENIIKNRTINSNNIRNIAKKIIEFIEVGENSIYIDNFGSSDKVGRLVNHSLNTAIYAYSMSTQLQYPLNKQISLIIGALLHDMGRLIDNSRHIEVGYQLIKQTNSFMPTENITIWQHHENVDGSGYPSGLRKDKIHEYSKIIAIADKFSRLIERGKTIYEAFEIVEGYVGVRYDEEIFKLFRDSIYIYPSGLQVKLNNGEVGVVAKQNKGFPTRPVIITNKVIDLVRTLDVFVEDIVI